MEIIVILIWLVLMCLCFWGLYCNNRTFNLRGEIREYIYNHQIDCIHNRATRNQNISWEEFDKTTYDQTLWAFFFFRDPKKLYHEDLQGAFDD